MRVDCFIDTNILVYAHDAQAGLKHDRARSAIEGFWSERALPSLSIQVLQELHVNLVRRGVAADASARLVSRYLSWRVLDNTRHLFEQALAGQPRWQVSFWDALIIAAAQRAGVTTLWSEDLCTGRLYDGVRVVNPLV